MAKEKVDPVQEAADEELRSAKLAEDPTERVTAELTRIRFEMGAIRKLMAHMAMAEQLKRSSKGGKPSAGRKARKR